MVFRVEGSGFGVQGLGFRDKGSGAMVLHGLVPGFSEGAVEDRVLGGQANTKPLLRSFSLSVPRFELMVRFSFFVLNSLGLRSFPLCGCKVWVPGFAFRVPGLSVRFQGF